MLCHFFEEMIATAEKSEMPKPFKAQIVGGLKYFHQQSICDFNRRDTKNTIKARWIDLETLLLGTSFLDKFRADKTRWSSVELFVGYSTKVPSHLKPLPPKPKSRLHGKDADQLIEFLARSIEAKPVLSKAERELVQFGLYYLELETKRGRSQRNKQRIQITWRTIQPILRKIGLLDEFDRDPDAIKKIKQFVSDKFL